MTFGKQKFDAEGKALKEELNYTCPWCDYSFSHFVRTVGEKKRKVSTQIVCPQCKNFIKTF